MGLRPTKAFRRQGGFSRIRRLRITVRAGCIPSCLCPDGDEVLPNAEDPLLQRNGSNRTIPTNFKCFIPYATKITVHTVYLYVASGVRTKVTATFDFKILQTLRIFICRKIIQ